MKVKFVLHGDAAKNFEDKASSLLLELKPEPERPLHKETQGSFSPDQFISRPLTEKDIIGEIKLSWVDHSGKEVARFFRSDERPVGLFGDSYTRLVQLAEQMHSSKELSRHVSLTLLVELLFDWLRDKYRNETTQTMTEYVLRECETRVQDLEIWIPIAATYVQSELRIGNIILKTITREIIARWRTQWKAETPEDEVKIDQLFDREQKKLQGLAAATIDLLAEPRRAFELALEETEKAIGLLRIFGPEVFSPEMSSYCTVLGKEHTETVTHLTVRGGRLVGLTHGTVDRAFVPFVLDEKVLPMIKGSGLTILSDLLAKETKNQFQEHVLEALQLYSRSCLEKNIPAKLIYIFAALESVLLRDQNESIQQNIAERMAFIIGKTADERKAIIKNIKSAYAFRSGFLHHGHGIDEVETIRSFMSYTWLFFTRLIQAANHFPTKVDFINAVEERKLA